MNFQHRVLLATVLVMALAATGACSAQGDGAAGPPASNAAGNVAASTAASGDADTASQFDCMKVFAPDDAVPILGKPGKVSNYASLDRACYFQAADFKSVLVRSGKVGGGFLQLAWNRATHSSNYTKVGGVGDAAYWRTTSNEILSRKGNLWCSVEGAEVHSEADARKSGELCNKVYASGM